MTKGKPMTITNFILAKIVQYFTQNKAFYIGQYFTSDVSKVMSHIEPNNEIMVEHRKRSSYTNLIGKSVTENFSVFHILGCCNHWNLWSISEYFRIEKFICNYQLESY